ncbi:radical SAM superfamily protein YgiQ [Gammaproteobacteria bacterium]
MNSRSEAALCVVNSTPNLFAYPKFWARRFGIAPFLPMSLAEMDALGWDGCDIILVTGDAYVDHPSFGMALIGRLLEAQGYRVGIIAQPDWRQVDSFRVLGRPGLFFGVTAGNMDSMVNHYTADRRPRSDDAYTPGGAAGRRPDRSVIVYCHRLREAFPGVPLVVGGIEASLRRVAHYDYWSDQVRRSLLVDAKADILLYGNAERALVALAARLARGEAIDTIHDLRGSAFLRRGLPAGWIEVVATTMDPQRSIASFQDHAPDNSCGDDRSHTVIRLPSFEEVSRDPLCYAHASRVLHRETNPGNARALVQSHGDRYLWLNPPPFPLTTQELDRVYELPYARRPHPTYGTTPIPAYEMIRCSVTIMRGCFGGCTFCSITAHEGRIVQSRSEESVIREIEQIRDNVPGFTGVISDLGGPTANMYHLRCREPHIESLCRRPSCVYPNICSRLTTDHTPLVKLYRRARSLPGIRRVLIASGLRYDLAVLAPDYLRELVAHHVGGYLKIAPEHIAPAPLAKMMKPDIVAYDHFKSLFDRHSRAAGKEQYLIPYFMAAHPGTRDEDMLTLALWLKHHDYRLDQVQTFLPSPMALATTMYHTGHDPLRCVKPGSEMVHVPKGERQRRLHKAFLRWHDPINWPLLREALRQMGRSDLIGKGKFALVPSESPTRRGLGIKNPRIIHRNI